MKADKEYIKKLKNIGLIIGNGFDLYCCLETKYKDFFESSLNSKINLQLQFEICQFRLKWHDETENKSDIEKAVLLKKAFVYRFSDSNICNIWYMFFFLSSVKDVLSNVNWCDLESVMYSSLKEFKPQADKFEKDIPSFCKIYKLYYEMQNNELSDICKLAEYNFDNSYILACFIDQVNNHQKFLSIEEFYDWLLAELKKFEKNFGEFIEIQHKEKKDYFMKNSKFFVEQICTKHNLKSIKTFNYDSLESNKLNKILVHINGNTNEPIFGIDSKNIKSNNPIRKFTKINRRNSFVSRGKQFERIPENLIIFGHSLCEADYSFFISEFERMNILEKKSKSKIVFAYSVPDGKTKEEIENNQKDNVFRLFQKYAESPNKMINANNLYEILDSQQRILFYEVLKPNK